MARSSWPLKLHLGCQVDSEAVFAHNWASNVEHRHQSAAIPANPSSGLHSSLSSRSLDRAGCKNDGGLAILSRSVIGGAGGAALRAFGQHFRWQRRCRRQAEPHPLICRASSADAVEGQCDVAPKTVVRNLGGGRGFGVVAVERIHEGERVLAEQPLVAVYVDGWAFDNSLNNVPSASSSHSPSEIAEYNRLIEAALDSCSTAHQSHFWELADVFAGCAADGQRSKTALGIMRTNAFQYGSIASAFRVACRLNHSCNPNVHRTWQEHGTRLVMHATRDIEAGTEICQSYIANLFCSFDQRQERLQNGWGFRCQCEACALPQRGRELSDAARKSLAVHSYKLKVYQEHAGGKLPGLDTTAHIEEQLWETIVVMSQDITQEFGSNPAMLFHVFRDAFRVAQALGRKKTAAYMAKLAYKASCCASGPQSDQSSEFQRYLQQH